MLGIDVLGGIRYEDRVKRLLPPGWAMGILLRDFDKGDLDSLTLVDWALQNHHDVRVHLDWEDDHEWNDKQLKRLVDYAKEVDGHALYGDRSKLYLSPLLEHRLEGEEAREFFAKIKHACQHSIIVNCGPGNIPGTIKETHTKSDTSSPGGRYIVSNDGRSCFDRNMKLWNRTHSEAEIRFVWDWRNNGRRNENDHTPRPKRKAWPSDQILKKEILLLRK